MTRRVAMLGCVLLVISAATPRAQAPAPLEEQVTVTSPGSSASIVGTLLVPKAGPSPVVLIIAGSGPTDRNGNSAGLPGANNSLRMLAEALAAQGIASLRYDKRGIGQSGRVTESDLRFDMYVDDAVAWIAKLRGDNRFTRIVVAGHSEGSLIGMLAAARGSADGFVSLAGVAGRASDVVRVQLRPLIGTTPMWDASEQVLSSLEAGTVVDPLPATLKPLAALYRPSVQPYLISWFRYRPSELIASLKVPVLIVQGTTDIQVSVDEAKALHAARPGAQLLIVEGMNHILKPAPADRQQNIATYSNPDLPLVADVSNAMGKFVSGLTR